MKTLIMLSAIPASGKSTWAKEYQANHPHTYIISSDDIRMEICNGNYHDQSKQQLVWETFENRIHEYAKLHEDVNVILDALNDVNVVRLKYLSTTPEYDKKILVLFPNTVERSEYYNGLRDEEVKVPDEIVKLLANKFEEPSEAVLELVDEVLTVKW
jgi:tRNA uridine 5-carbamoylmethylation protein Kti12